MGVEPTHHGLVPSIISALRSSRLDYPTHRRAMSADGSTARTSVMCQL
jgi:hypothetical protein